jgi:hypothetical protein
LNSAVGLGGVLEGIGLLIGIAALALSVILGALGWITALRPPSSVAGIFGRGFLGVSAVLSFGVAAIGLGLGMDLWLGQVSPWVILLFCVLFMLFLAIEFAIAGTLYRRSHRHRPSDAAKVLAYVSYALSGLFSLGTFATLFLGVITITAPPREYEPPQQQELPAP